MEGSRFGGTNLELADFRSAWGFAFDPDENRMKGAKFSKEGLAGLLAKYAIKVY